MDPQTGSSREHTAPSAGSTPPFTTPPTLPLHPPTRPGTAPIYRRPPVWPAALGILGCVGGSAVALSCAWRATTFLFVEPMVQAVQNVGAPAAAASMQAVRNSAPALSIFSGITALVATALIIGSARLILRRRDAARWIGGACAAALLAVPPLVFTEYQMQSAQFQAMTVGTGNPASAVATAGIATVSTALGVTFSLILNGGPFAFMAIWMFLPFVHKEVRSW